jgi:hypothetical protein
MMVSLLVLCYDGEQQSFGCVRGCPQRLGSPGSRPGRNTGGLPSGGGERSPRRGGVEGGHRRTGGRRRSCPVGLLEPVRNRCGAGGLCLPHADALGAREGAAVDLGGSDGEPGPQPAERPVLGRVPAGHVVGATGGRLPPAFSLAERLLWRRRRGAWCKGEPARAGSAGVLFQQELVLRIDPGVVRRRGAESAGCRPGGGHGVGVGCTAFYGMYFYLPHWSSSHIWSSLASAPRSSHCR